VYAKENEFSMRHDMAPSFNREKLEVDLYGFLHWCVGERRSLVQRIREARKAHVVQ